MKRVLPIIAFLPVLFAGCKEMYDPGIINPETGYLVVEGFINSGSEPTSISLSRTTKLTENIFSKPELNARVTVEGDDNKSFSLVSTSPGIYSSAQPLTLNTAVQYRLKINTANGNEYVSAYSSIKHSPVIDSITWKRENGGVQIYVNNHDDNTNEKSYYRWTFQEIWEIRSTYLSNLKYETNTSGNPVRVIYKYPDQSPDYSMYYCWQNSRSANILLGSTERLSQNVIYLPITHIQQGSIKLGVLYSIEIKQHALSKNAYDFYLQMKKNTEQLGSIFDPQPSDLRGNITCTSNPGEIVIGHIEVNKEENKRIFIYNSQVPGWGYSRFCDIVSIANNERSIIENLQYMPIAPEEFNLDGSIKSFSASAGTCVDCQTRGSNIKPSFWPN